jgi:ferredoxin
MQWIPYDADYIVACNSKDKGKKVRKICSVGCIACKVCEKKSPEGGYKVEDFLSRIDYQATGDRSAGAAACPTKCIIPVKEQMDEGEKVTAQKADEET